MSQIKTLFNNISWITFSQIITNICAFLWTILIARYLGVTNYGILSFVISFTVIIGMGTDMGITSFTTREIAKDKSKTNKYINNLILFKIVLTVFITLFTIILVYLLGYNHLIIVLSTIMIIEASVVTMFNFVSGIFQAHEKLKPSAIGLIIYSFFLLFLVTLISLFDLGIVAIALAYTISYSLGLLYVFNRLVKEFGFHKFEFDLDFLKETTIKSLPFALTVFFNIIYFSLDVVMISWLSDGYATGLYNSAYRIISVFITFYTIYQFVIYPLMSKLYSEDTNMLKVSFEQSFKYSLLMLLPIVIGVYLYAPYLITLIYGQQYSLAYVPMRILIWTVIFLFINGVAISLLNSIGKEFAVTKIYIIAAVFNIVLNYMMIPILSYNGAAITTVLSEILIFVLMMYSISKTEYYPDKSLLKTVIKLILCSLILFVVLYIINVSLWLAIPIGLVVYVASLFITRTIDDTDKYIINELLNRK